MWSDTASQFVRPGCRVQEVPITARYDKTPGCTITMIEALVMQSLGRTMKYRFSEILDVMNAGT
jgi:hypothetical protein